MCRLMACTNTAMDHSMRRLIFTQLMLTSNADGQRDGSGMSDGIVVYKSAYPFLRMGVNWVHALLAKNIWIGHVRAASRHTEISPYASHPFSFLLDDGRTLIAAHNGFINGMPAAASGEPNVDSYQAFKSLAAILNRIGGELTPAIVNEWTATFGADSEWSFMFLLNGALTIIRGNRAVSYVSLDSGFLFNTSSDILLHIKDWIAGFWSGHKVGRIFDIKEFHMLTLRPNEQVLLFEPITPQVKSPAYENMAYLSKDGITTLIKA